MLTKIFVRNDFMTIGAHIHKKILVCDALDGFIWTTVFYLV